MRLIKTAYTRLKSLQASPDQSFFSVVTNSGIAFWGTKELRKVFDDRPDELLCQMQPSCDVPSGHRILSSTVTVIQAESNKKTKKKTKKKTVEKAKGKSAQVNKAKQSDKLSQSKKIKK